METNMVNEAKTGRIMWFSMWFLGAIVSFGLAFFPLFYYSVDRRNQHFRRQQQFEKETATSFQKDWSSTSTRDRNAKFLAASIILILPVFVIMYFLSKDFNEHEKHQKEFLKVFYPEWKYVPQKISIKTCTLITLATLGFGVIYWLYKIVNVYNNHFKEQHHIEYELLKLMREQEAMSSPCSKRRFVSHGGDVWGFSRKYNTPLEQVLDFSGPINFLGPSQKAVEAVKQQSRLIRFYPDPNPAELRAEIARYVGHGVTEKNIILGNGSIELIYMIAEVFPCNFKAVIPVPSFTEYEKAVLRVHGETIFVQLPLVNFGLEIERIKKAVTEDTKLMFVCNPHSPSGALYSRDMVLDLLKFCKEKDIILSVDENYIEFAPKGDDATMVGYVNEYTNLFVIRSITKFYGMPGIRFGYGIAAEELIDTLQTVRQPWSINTLAGYATLAAFSDKEFIENSKRVIAEEKAKFAKKLAEIGGLWVFPSETNFLLVKIQNPKFTSTGLRDAMAKEGMLMRDCSTFVGLDDKYFRVTVRSDADNSKLVDGLRKVMGKQT